MEMSITKRFWEAVENRDRALRQDFIDSLTLDARKYARRIKYIPNSSKNIMITCGDLTKAPISPFIYIFKEAFSTHVHRNVADLLSTLDDHEGFHAYEYVDRPQILRPETHPELHFLTSADQDLVMKAHELLSVQCERRAYQNQVDKFPFRNVSKEYKELIYSRVRIMEETEQDILKNL